MAAGRRHGAVSHGFYRFPKNAHGLHKLGFLSPKNLWKLRWRETYFHFTATNYKYHRLPATIEGKFHWGSGIKLEMALFKKHFKHAWPRAVWLTWDSQVPNSTTGMSTTSPQTDCSLQFVTKHHEWRRRISLKPKGYKLPNHLYLFFKVILPDLAEDLVVFSHTFLCVSSLWLQFQFPLN